MKFHYRYLRMSLERFDHLLSLVEPPITKEDTNYRKLVSPAKRLALMNCFLATGESPISLSLSFRIGKSTVSKIIAENCDALHRVHFHLYVKRPTSNNKWKAIPQEEIWNLPHVVGVIDGKHTRIKCPKSLGTLHHNYKGLFSLLILATCDARYCFTLIDVDLHRRKFFISPTSSSSSS